MPVTVKLQSPAQILDAIPATIGFQPVESMVTIALKENRVVCTMRSDLDSPACVNGLAMIARQTPDSVIVAVFSANPDSVRAELLELLSGFDAPVHDVLWTTGERWGSWTCPNPECCPPEGRPFVTTGTGDQLAAAMMRPPLPDRAAVVATVALESDVPATAPIPVADVLTDALADVGGSIATLRDVAWRDEVMVKAAKNTDELRRIVGLARYTTEPMVLGACAVAAYLNGDGVLARAICDRVDPPSGLIQLVSLALDAGMPPSMLADSLAATA